VEKAGNITYSECEFVAFVNQHAKHMFRIMSSVACPALPVFPHFAIKGMVFGGGVIEHKMCVLMSSTITV